MRNMEERFTYTDTYARPMFDRGFTGHEHLQAFGLINMNGRMYDPVMSSFLSADRYIQDPTTAQGFNRYAYCMYNPLRFTDPTGWVFTSSHGSPPRSVSGLIQDYLSDPCYITRQQLRDAGIYCVEGGYGYVGGSGSMGAHWMEGFGIGHYTSWDIQTDNSGFEAGAWAIPDSFYPMWINYCQGLCNYGSCDYEKMNLNINSHSTLNIENGVIEEKPIKTGNYIKGIGFANYLLGTALYQQSKHWINPKHASRIQKQDMQKIAYNIQKKQKLKGFHPQKTSKIKAIRGAKLAKVSGGSTIFGLGLETADVLINQEVQMSNVVGAGVTVASFWFWPAGAIYLGVDIGSLLFTGNDIGFYIDEWYGDSVYEW